MADTQKSREGSLKRFGRLFFADGSLDVQFFVYAVMLLTVGLVMLYSASYPSAANKYGDPSYYFRRQLVFAVIGVVMMLVISKVNYVRFKLIGAVGGFGLSVLMLVAVFFAPAEDGIHRWIYVGGQQFQPSEFVKLALIVICAFILGDYYDKVAGKKPLPWGEKINSFFRMPLINESLYPIFAAGGVIALFTALVFMEKHLSGTILMFGIGLTMLFLGGVRKKWFIIGGTLAVLLFAFLYFETDILADYMQERIDAWVDKSYDPLGARWQTNQALYAIGSGGLLGEGLGGSKQKYLYVSEPQNDMIFSIVCEELGVLGAAVVILLFCLLIWRGVVIGINAGDRFGMLLSMGIVFQLGLQVILNIAVATDSVPNTGISLPFFSYGGTSLVMIMAEMGLVLSVSRQAKLRKGTLREHAGHKKNEKGVATT